MDNYQNSVMIALLPMTDEWCKIDLPHLTLATCGEVTDWQVTDFNSMAKDAAAIAMVNSIITLRVMGVEVFGLNEKVDVYRLRNTPELMALRRPVARWHRSEFAYNPHCTIGPVGSAVAGEMPGYIAFDRVMVKFGEQDLTFRLKAY